jgi:hypothetical protein
VNNVENKFLISEIKPIVTKSLCCPDIEIIKTRVVFANTGNAPTQIMKHFAATRQEIISYKALIKRSGRGREIEFKRVGLVASNNPILQGVQAAGSILLPGNLSKYRSPIRSAIARTLTPEIPGIPSVRRRDGYSRCPEGYQYGGRFTDNRFSTCGQKLFAIAGLIGRAIGLVRRVLEQEAPNVNVTGTVLGAGDYGPDGIIRRPPQIPRVSLSNPAKARAEIQKLVKPLGAVDQPTVRMVRRDGFVLEPVVPASVLRTIPDNRDMEGATYLMSVASPDVIGKDELGLLSNTGVRSVKYVLPGGSEITLEKRRPLTIGERRKLGRTVNTAIDSDNTKDPASRLKMVAMETGDGIKYSEKFVGIKNPNEIGKDGRQKWASISFGKRKPRVVADEIDVDDTPVPQSVEPIGDKITSVSDAMAHIARGGSLSKISPEILQQALAKTSGMKRDRISESRFMLTMTNGDKYIEQSKPLKFEALSQRFTSEIQRNFGLESPNIIFVGEGDSRKYLVESAETAVRGGKLKDNALFRNAPWQEVSRLFISDLFTDVSNRNPGSVEIVDSKNRAKIVPMTNDGAGLVALSKISIRERTEAALKKLLEPENSRLYLQYFSELRKQQRAQVIQFIATLIQRAREFSFTNFKSKLYNDGKLSAGEKIHLNILEKMYNQRLNMLVAQSELFSQIVSGG